MKYYAEGIQKFERQKLRLPVSTFLDILENGVDSTKQKGESDTATNEL